jgi:hypothetical protein
MPCPIYDPNTNLPGGSEKEFSDGINREVRLQLA